MFTLASEQDSDLVFQAGATWDGINAMLEEKGIHLFFPVCLCFRITSRTHDVPSSTRGMEQRSEGWSQLVAQGVSFIYFASCPDLADIVLWPMPSGTAPQRENGFSTWFVHPFPTKIYQLTASVEGSPPL